MIPFQKRVLLKIVSFKLYSYLLGIVTSRISVELDNSKSLNINTYEIRIDSSFNQENSSKDKSLIKTYLFECQCALFLVDITKEDSFILIKDLLEIINSFNFPYLEKILVLNKLDLESERVVKDSEIEIFLQANSGLDKQEISLKNGDNLKELLNKINSSVNETKNELPTNMMSEFVGQKITFSSAQKSLSFILIGDTCVGKTCFLTRYFKNQFTDAFLATIGIDKELKNVKIGDEVIKITLWDTTGQERFKSLPKKYYQNADGVLLLFDVTEEETFNNVTKWMNDVKDNSNKNFSNEDGKESDIALYLIGNKIDLPGRVITREQAEIQAKSLGMKYFEVSCKINMNIPEVMARMIIDCNMKANHNENSFKLKSKKGDKKKKWGCCGEKEKKINN